MDIRHLQLRLSQPADWVDLHRAAENIDVRCRAFQTQCRSSVGVTSGTRMAQTDSNLPHFNFPTFLLGSGVNHCSDCPSKSDPGIHRKVGHAQLHGFCECYRYSALHGYLSLKATSKKPSAPHPHQVSMPHL